MIKIDDINLINFYEDYMVAYNGIVYYCQFCPSGDFPEEKGMGVFVISTSNGVETLCSYWEVDVVWSLI